MLWAQQPQWEKRLFVNNLSESLRLIRLALFKSDANPFTNPCSHMGCSHGPGWISCQLLEVKLETGVVSLQWWVTSGLLGLKSFALWVYSTCSGLESCSDWWNAGKWCCTCSQHWPQESLQFLLFLGTLDNHCENQPGGWETTGKRVQSPEEAGLDQQTATWPPQMYAQPNSADLLSQPEADPRCMRQAETRTAPCFHSLMGNDKYFLFINLFLAASSLGCGTPYLCVMQSLSVVALELSSCGPWAQ